MKQNNSPELLSLSFHKMTTQIYKKCRRMHELLLPYLGYIGPHFWCRGGSRYVQGCWGFPYLKICWGFALFLFSKSPFSFFMFYCSIVCFPLYCFFLRSIFPMFSLFEQICSNMMVYGFSKVFKSVDAHICKNNMFIKMFPYVS